MQEPGIGVGAVLYQRYAWPCWPPRLDSWDQSVAPQTGKVETESSVKATRPILHHTKCLTLLLSQLQKGSDGITKGDPSSFQEEEVGSVIVLRQQGKKPGLQNSIPSSATELLCYLR